jgi:ATP-dependent DNA helicase RecG
MRLGRGAGRSVAIAAVSNGIDILIVVAVMALFFHAVRAYVRVSHKVGVVHGGHHNVLLQIPWSAPCMFSGRRWATRASSKRLKASTVNDATDIFSRPVGDINGVGTVMEERLKRLDLSTVGDVLLNVPYKISDRSMIKALSNYQENDKVVVELTCVTTKTDIYPRPNKVVCKSLDGLDIDISYFMGPNHRFIWYSQLKTIFKAGNSIIVAGKLTKYQNRLTIVNPEFVFSANDSSQAKKHLVAVPVYPLTAGLTASKYKSVVESALALLAQNVTSVLDWHCPINLARLRWPTFVDALAQLHKPKSETDVSPMAPARERLAFDELVALELSGLQRDCHNSGAISTVPVADYVIPKAEGLLKILEEMLPYELTPCQSEAIANIASDLSSSERMVRFIQGDVGSGKTGTF